MSDKQANIDAIVAECHAQGVTLNEQIAYVLATAEHETNGTYAPVKEGYYLKNPLSYLKKLRYYPYYGRGLVQLTWLPNYRKYQDLLGLPMVANPDIALRPAVAIFILVHGMRHGTFTGKKLTNYITASHIDFYGARRIINGTDKAQHIAGLARAHLTRLRQNYEVAHA